MARESISFFGLPELYDYAADALGSGSILGDSGTRWAEVAAVLVGLQVVSSRRPAPLCALDCARAQKLRPRIVRDPRGLSGSNLEVTLIGVHFQTRGLV